MADIEAFRRQRDFLLTLTRREDGCFQDLEWRVRAAIKEWLQTGAPTSSERHEARRIVQEIRLAAEYAHPAGGWGGAQIPARPKERPGVWYTETSGGLPSLGKGS